MVVPSKAELLHQTWLRWCSMLLLRWHTAHCRQNQGSPLSSKLITNSTNIWTIQLISSNIVCANQLCCIDHKSLRVHSFIGCPIEIEIFFQCAPYRQIGRMATDFVFIIVQIIFVYSMCVRREQQQQANNNVCPVVESYRSVSQSVAQLKQKYQTKKKLFLICKQGEAHTHAQNEFEFSSKTSVRRDSEGPKRNIIHVYTSHYNILRRCAVWFVVVAEICILVPRIVYNT